MDVPLFTRPSFHSFQNQKRALASDFTLTMSIYLFSYDRPSPFEGPLLRGKDVCDGGHHVTEHQRPAHTLEHPESHQGAE